MKGPNIFIIALIALLFTQVCALTYNVHWLKDTVIIDKDKCPMKETVDIYCYTGTTKSITTIWQTVKFQIKIKNDEFRYFVGSNPQEVFDQYVQEYGWAMSTLFPVKPQKTVSVNIFNATCMAIDTKHRHAVELHVIKVDLWRVFLMFIGISIIYTSKSLSGNPLFFYLCGIFLGVFASFMVLIYYISKMLPKKTMTYGVLIGGWTVGIYVFQQIYGNIRSIITAYMAYVLYYTLIVSFISFLICYRIGPPRNERSKNLVMWTLQAIGLSTIFFSSEYQEASSTVIILTFTIKYFPDSLLQHIKGYWHRRFPPRPRLLSSEEYYEEGARETKQALEQLRKYCSSPDCAQWRIMLKLNDSKRFASFVEGDSHLSDNEILNYETYAYSLEGSRLKHTALAHSSANDMEISDDDSSHSEEL